MNQLQEPYDRILFPQTVTCTGCGQQLPPAIICWMVNGHIHCTGCKDKAVQHEAQAHQAKLARQITETLRSQTNPTFAPNAYDKDEFCFPDDFDLHLDVQ